jgi:hypothetical protein
MPDGETRSILGSRAKKPIALWMQLLCKYTQVWFAGLEPTLEAYEGSKTEKRKSVVWDGDARGEDGEGKNAKEARVRSEKAAEQEKETLPIATW